MTRKRFIKLMMATGLPRNYVISNLGVARVTGGYRRFYEGWKQFLKSADELAHE